MPSNNMKSNTFKKIFKNQGRKSKRKANGNMILQQKLKDSPSYYKKNKHNFETNLKQEREEFNR